MPTTFNTIAINQVFVNENPMVFWIGSSPIFNINWLGSGTLTSPVNTLYRNKEDVSSTYLSGSTTVSGRVQTTKQATFSVAGEYEFYFQVTDGGMVRIKALRILIKKLGVY
jgi:hypothetical protein